MITNDYEIRSYSESVTGLGYSRPCFFRQLDVKEDISE